MWVQLSTEASIDAHETGVTGHCQLSHVGAGNWTLVRAVHARKHWAISPAACYMISQEGWQFHGYKEHNSISYKF